MKHTGMIRITRWHPTPPGAALNRPFRPTPLRTLPPACRQILEGIAVPVDMDDRDALIRASNT